jgi:protein SCO1/2
MNLSRRLLLAGAPMVLAGCHHDLSAQDVNIYGLVPDLDFTLTEAQTGAVVTAQDFAGRVTMLYFGYTNCPDVCPATLYNIDRVFQAMGGKAANIRLLFVTVDPDRDTLPVLTQYTVCSANRFWGCAARRTSSMRWRGATGWCSRSPRHRLIR